MNNYLITFAAYNNTTQSIGYGELYFTSPKLNKDTINSAKELFIADTSTSVTDLCVVNITKLDD